MPTRRWKSASFRLLGSLLCLGLLIACLPVRSAWAADAQETAASETKRQALKDWQLLLTLHQEALVQQAARVKAMGSMLSKDVRRFRADLAAQQSKLDELGLIVSLSSGNPRELRAVLNDMEQLRRSTDVLVAPLQDARDELQKISSQLDSLNEEFSKRLAEEPDAKFAAILRYYMRYLTGVKASLSGERAMLDKQLEPVREFLDSLDASRKALRKKIPEAWRTYYLGSSAELFAWKGWSRLGDRLRLWARSNGTMLESLTMGADTQRTLSLLTKIAIGLMVLLVFDAMAWRRLRFRFPNLPEQPLARRTWRLAGLGLLLHWVALDAPLLLYEGCNGLAEILLAAALTSLAWFLTRVTGTVEDAKVRNPLRWVWRLYALGILSQIIGLPEPAQTGCWLVLLVVFFIIMRKPVLWEGGPLRPAGRVTPLVMVGLVAMTAFGWQHLSILVLTAWFLLLASVQIGMELARLVKNWQDRAERAGTSSFARSMVAGLGFPLIFLSLFFLALYWFSAELGGTGMFLEAVSFTVTVGSMSVTLGRLALILTGFFVTRALISVARSFLKDLPRLRPEIDAGAFAVLETTALYLLWGCYALISLFLLGFSLTSLAVVAGGLSVGIGLGLQNIVNNFVSGLILLFGRSIEPGDTIQIGETWGQVVKVNIRNTMIQTFDNAMLFVPNADLVAGKIVNWSHRDRTVRKDLVIGVAYGSDVDLVRSLLLGAATEHPRVLGDPAPFVQFVDFADSSLNFKLFFWVDDVSVGMSTLSDIRFTLERRFRDAGISIPFPQREVRLLGNDPEPEAPADAPEAPDAG